MVLCMILCIIIVYCVFIVGKRKLAPSGSIFLVKGEVS